MARRHGRKNCEDHILTALVLLILCDRFGRRSFAFLQASGAGPPPCAPFALRPAPESCSVAFELFLPLSCSWLWLFLLLGGAALQRCTGSVFGSGLQPLRYLSPRLSLCALGCSCLWLFLLLGGAALQRCTSSAFGSGLQPRRYLSRRLSLCVFELFLLLGGAALQRCTSSVFGSGLQPRRYLSTA
jgi:hypothetical protein